MGAFTIAWMIGIGLESWQSWKHERMPPGPGRVLAASGWYVMLAVVAQYGPARSTVTILAYATDLAVLMQDLTKAKPATGAGWSALKCAGNTVIFPDGTLASAVTAAGSTSSTSSTATAPASGTVLQEITALAKQFGWDNATQISAWQKVLGAESSGGNPTALNPGSGAYGAAQALGHGTSGTACPSTGRNQYGGYGLTTAQAQAANCGNLADQLLWMANYIKQKYGTPAAAWAHEQSAGWY